MPEIDGNDLARSGVGDVGMPSVGVRGRIARLAEAVDDARDGERPAVDDAERTDAGVADERRIVSDALDAARIRKAPDRAHDAARAHVHDGEAGLAVARRDCEQRRCGWSVER